MYLSIWLSYSKRKCEFPCPKCFHNAKITVDLNAVSLYTDVEIVQSGLDRYTKQRTKEDAMVDDAINAFADAMVKEGRLTEEQVGELQGKKYALIGEIGASALDKVEEITFRMDNLAIARQMEERLNTLLSETEDVAREDQIFLRDGVEMAMAAKKKRCYKA